MDELHQRRRILMERTAWLAVGVVVFSGIWGGLFIRGLNPGFDWKLFVEGCRYFWEHRGFGGQGWMFGYTPGGFFFLMPFTVWLTSPWGLLLHVAGNAAAAIGSVWVVHRWWTGGRLGGGIVWPVLLVAINIQQVLQMNQLSLWVLVLCAGGLALAGRGWPFWGGALIGLAVAIKVMPLVLLGYFGCRGQWRALLGVAAGVIALDVVPSVLFLGYDGAAVEHRAWRERSGWYSPTAQIYEPLRLGIYHHRSNFSYPSVLVRWLRGLPEVEEMVVLRGDPPAEAVEAARAGLRGNQALVVDPLPLDGKPWARQVLPISRSVPRWSAARWPAERVWWVWAASVGLGMGLLAVWTWWTGRIGQGRDWPAASAAWMLSMFWLTPLMMNYYLVLAFPAMAVVWLELVRSRRKTPGRWLAIVGLAAWVVGEACIGWRDVRWYGVHWVVLAVLGAAVVWAWARQLGLSVVSEAGSLPAAAERVVERDSDRRRQAGCVGRV